MSLEYIKKNWKRFGKDNYIFHRLYDCDGHRFANSDFIPSYHGGLFVRYTNGNLLETFSNSGQPVSSSPYKITDLICTAFWCSGSNIGFLYFNGDIDIISLKGDVVSNFKAPDDSYVKYASSFFNGIAVITNSNTLCMFDYQLMRYQAFTKIDIPKETSCFTFYRGNKTEGYLAYQDGSIVCIGQRAITQIASLNFSPSKMIVSPNAINIAVQSPDQVTIISTQPSQTTYTYHIAASSIAWVTDETFLLVSNKRLHFFQLPDFHHEFDQDMIVHLVIQDIDNVRVYSDNGLFLFMKVPKEVVQLYRIKEVSSFITVYNYFTRKNLNAYKELKKIELPQTALEAIIQAAQVSIDLDVQNFLFFIVAFIQKCLPEVKITDNYVTALNNVVLLNSLRSRDFGFATTFASLKYVSPASYIDIAVSLNLFSFAMKICNMFNFNTEAIAARWALAILKKNGEMALHLVLERLTEYQTFDYRPLSKFAFSNDFTPEGIYSICDRIFPINDRVMALSKIKNSDPMNVAIKTKDGEAIISVLCLNKLTSSVQKFVSLLGSSRDIAAHYALFKSFIDPSMLRKIPNFDKKLLLQWTFITTPNQASILKENEKFNLVQSCFEQNSPFIKAMDSQQNVLQVASKIPNFLEERAKNPTTRAQPPSARRIVMKYAELNDISSAKKFAKKFGFSDRTYGLIVGDSMAKKEMWPEFENFLSSLKDGPTNEDIAEMCFRYNNQTLGMKYLNTLPQDVQQSIIHRFGLSG